MNLYANEIWSIEPEGRFFIVTYRTIDGKKEKVFESEDDAIRFTNSLQMEEKLKLIDEISTLVVGIDLDVYVQNEDIHEKVCISDATARITEKLFKLKQLIKQDNHGRDKNQ